MIDTGGLNSRKFLDLLNTPLGCFLMQVKHILHLSFFYSLVFVLCL